jgi:hypothetical protein
MDDSLATFGELAGGLDHHQTGDRHQMAQKLIGKMSRENPLWSVPRLQTKLCLLGHDLAGSTVAKY